MAVEFKGMQNQHILPLMEYKGEMVHLDAAEEQ